MVYLSVIDAFLGLWQEIFAAIIVLSVGWSWGHWRAGQAWHKREFKNRLVLSLNCLSTVEVSDEEGKNTSKPCLKLRTIFERDIIDVFQSHPMVNLVNKAISKITDQDPLLRFEEKDIWHILNVILNQIAEEFSAGTMKQDMGIEVTTKTYTFCLTYETAGEMRTRKPRIMIIEKEKLSNFPETEDFVLESELHRARIQTLQYLKKERNNSPHLFRDMEISL